MRCFLATALTAFFSFAWSGAEAATVTGTFNVQVTIAATCALNRASNLNFGTQGVLAANVDQTSTSPSPAPTPRLTISGSTRA